MAMAPRAEFEPPTSEKAKTSATQEQSLYYMLSQCGIIE